MYSIVLLVSVIVVHVDDPKIDLPTIEADTVKVSFDVKSVKVFEWGVYMNSNRNFNAPNTDTVVIQFSKTPELKKYNWNKVLGKLIIAKGLRDNKNRCVIQSGSDIEICIPEWKKQKDNRLPNE